MVRARDLLSKFYADAQAPLADEVDDLNIDGPEFNVEKYIANLLQNKSLEELVQRGNAMVSEIKNLDSDMQMLVYENYNKFIAATDTIRQMKHRVEVRMNRSYQKTCTLLMCAWITGYGVTDDAA